MLAHEIAAQVASGLLSAEAVVREALRRARAVQEAYNAFITLAEERALVRARALDARRAAGEPLGPLAGVPVVLKDNLCTEGLRTTAASRSLEGFVPSYSATVVLRLEAAGAVVIAKSNMDEFAMGSSTEYSAFGAARNPWDRSRVPGGSSGGSAIAVAAGVAPVALGTDTGGSVRQPASFTGVLGFKPTYGRLSRYGVIAYASSLEQVGVLCRSSADLALVLGAIGGHDPKDATSLAGDFELGALELPDGTPLRGIRVGVVRELCGEGNSPGVLAALERSREQLRALGARVTEVSLPSAAYGVAAYYLVAPAEASSNLARYDGMLYGRRGGENGLGQAEVMMRSRGATFGPEVRRRVLIGSYALSAGYYDAFYGKALKVRRLIAEELARAFARCDLLLTPSAPSVAYPLGAVADPLAMYAGDVHTVLANLTGVPAISVPAGAGEDGLPCGVQLMAPALGDAALLRAAAAMERAAGSAFAPLAPGYPLPA